MSGREVNALLSELHAASMNGEQSLLNAAKSVVALSGWTKTSDGRNIFQSSYMAIQTLRKAIEQHENPVLHLAPEPLPRGL